MNDDVYTSIKDMMNHMNSGKPFSIVYITWDKAKGAGGTVKEIQLAYKHYSPEEVKEAGNEARITLNKKSPNHYHNGTINIKIPGQGSVDVRKVHVQLIRRFNGAIVK